MPGCAYLPHVWRNRVLQVQPRVWTPPNPCCELSTLSHTAVYNLLLGSAFPSRTPQRQMDHVLGSRNNSDQGPQAGGEHS